jgi:hypothetical protein
MLKFVIAVIALLVAVSDAHSNDVAFERMEKEYSVEKDGSFTLTSSVLVRLNTENGAKGMGQVPIPFSANNRGQTTIIFLRVERCEYF